MQAERDLETAELNQLRVGSSAPSRSENEQKPTVTTRSSRSAAFLKLVINEAQGGDI
ncbi:hypothetical protein D3C84_1262180 [compost metagenome]